MVTVLLAASLISANVQAVAASPDLSALDWLVGEWRFEDRPTGATATPAESGIRVCAYALDNQYIRCESQGQSAGKARTYVFYFSYDPVDLRYEMVAMHGNWPRTLTYTLQVSNGGRRVEFLSDPYREGNLLRRSWGVLTYEAPNLSEWKSGTFEDGSSDRGPIRFIETAIKSSESR